LLQALSDWRNVMPRIPRDFDFETDEEYERYLPDYCPEEEDDDDETKDEEDD